MKLDKVRRLAGADRQMTSMKRVHRKLSRDDVEALRDKLALLVPEATAQIPDLLRTMRLIARQSQSEYAKLCGVAPRVLADVEAGKGHHGSTRSTSCCGRLGFEWAW